MMEFALLILACMCAAKVRLRSMHDYTNVFSSVDFLMRCLYARSHCVSNGFGITAPNPH